MNKKKAKISRAEYQSRATQQHSTICQFLNKAEIYALIKEELDVSNELIIFERMCKSELPVKGEDLKVMEVASTRSSAAERLGNFLEKFSDRFEVLKEERVVITLPRQRGRIQIGYYFACVDTVSGEYLDPKETSELLQMTWHRHKQQGERLDGSLERHLCSFESFIDERTRNFVGRKFVFDAIDDFLDNNESGYFFIRGDPGVGKSAVIAELIKRYCLTVYHFNIALQAINTPRQFLANTCARLIMQFSLRYTELPIDFDKDGAFFSMLLHKASANLSEGDKLVIAVDALDELKHAACLATANPLFLPSDLPKGVCFVLTARKQHDLALQASHIHEWVLESDSEANKKDIRSFIKDYLAHDGIKAWIGNRKISREKFIDIMWEKSEGNFMYLHHVLPAIEQGRFSTGSTDELPHGLLAYYRCHWAQMRQSEAERFELFYQPVVCILAAAREPVSVDQVAEWTRLEPMQVLKVFRTWSEFLHEESDDRGEKLYRIYHTAFRDFLQKEVDPGLKTYHAMIADAVRSKIRN